MFLAKEEVENIDNVCASFLKASKPTLFVFFSKDGRFKGR